MTIQTMPCYRCKTEITIRPNVKYCKVCAPIVKAEQNAAKNSFKTEQRRQDREAKRKVEKERTEARIIITDEEQLQINKAIDNKHNFQLACRTISPGDHDFAEIAAKVTRIGEVRFGLSIDRPVFYAEADPAKLYRRHETHSEARG